MLGRKGIAFAVTVLLLVALTLAGCGAPAQPSQPAETLKGSQPSQTSLLTLNGAGATFPYPLYSKWFDEYAKVNPNVRVNYQSIGSGGGINQITQKTVNFGASDGPMTDEQLAKAPGEILHIPTTAGAVAVAYNLPGIPSGLKLDGATLADIFLGKIKKWNDSRLTRLNPDLKLPATDIVVVHRSDGSGTTFIFTDYLSQVSPEWKEKVGKSTSVKWPTGLGGKGNEGVAGQIQQTPGSIGYVELAYALQNKMPYAKLKNQAGNFVEPSLPATTVAAAGMAEKMPADLRVSIVNSPAPDAYPIVGFTWILVYKNQDDPVKGRALVDMLWWAIHDGQKYTEPLNYARLPEQVVKLNEAKIRSINYQGQQLLSK